MIPFTIRDFFAIHCGKFDYSYSTVYKILRMNNISSTFGSRKIKKLCSKQLSSNLEKYNLNEELIKLLTTNNEYNHKKHQKSQKTLKPFGYEVEIDGCIHFWVPELGNYNILLITDSSGYLVSASLDVQETNRSYIDALVSMVNKYGVPRYIKGDKRRSIYSDGINDTPLVKPLVGFGCTVECNSNATFKPHVEGDWSVLQKALPNYLHERNIKDQDRLKKFVEEELCDWYNKNYNKKHSNIDMFIKTDFEHFLNAYSYNIQRKVQKGNFIYLDNEVYAPYNRQNKRVLMKEKGIINVYKSIKEGKDAKWFIRYRNDKCYLKKVNKDNDFIDIKVFDDSLAYDETQEIIWGLQDKNL